MATIHSPPAELVGRDPELAALAQAVDDAGAGRGRVVLLTGEAGIGKTCLAEATAGLARAEGFAVVWGRCSADDAPAYWPWSQVLSAISEGDLMEPGRFSTRAELFAAVAEAVLARSRQRPLLVVAEDVHWADSDSLRLVEFLAAVVAGERLLLLASTRSGGSTGWSPEAAGLMSGRSEAVRQGVGPPQIRTASIAARACRSAATAAVSCRRVARAAVRGHQPTRLSLVSCRRRASVRNGRHALL